MSDADNDSPESRAAKSRVRLSRARGLIAGSLLGLAVALVAALAIMFANRESIPRLTQADFDAAIERWEAQGPRSYAMDITLGGRRAGQVQIAVEDGEVVRMTRDGVEPSQRRTWDYWSVPGMLDTIARELEMAQDPSATFAPGAAQVVMWAEFDTRYGYPKRFRRAVLGADFEIDWTVTRFSPSEKVSSN